MADPSQLELLEHYRITRARSESAVRRRHEADWVRKDELGRGSVGTVFLETEATTGAARAVKEVRKSSRIDFRAELIALTRLAKPAYTESFGQFLGWWETETIVGFVLEYFEQGDLRNFLQEPWLERDSKDVAGQLLSGVKLMHADGFTHRDLKPENIFVVHTKPFFKVKIGDFGVSKRVNSKTLLRTQVGTRMYMAPEVLDFFDDEIEGYTESVDIWAVGVIIFETLSARRPFTDSRSLKRYCKDVSLFPAHLLSGNAPAAVGVEFLRALLNPEPSARPNAEAAMELDWLIADSSPPSPGVSSPSLAQIPKVVVGVSFGTVYTRVSWTIDDGLIRLVKTWPGLHHKAISWVPSAISYKDGKVSKWGYEALWERERLEEFQPFLELDPKVVSTNTSRRIGKSAVPVVSDYLRNVWQATLRDIENHLPNEYVEKSLKTFVTTVPRVWSGKGKENLLTATTMAGLYPVHLINETDASSIYALHMLRDEYPKASRFEVGDAFLLCQIGQSSVGLISQTISCLLPNLRLEELVVSKGTTIGSGELNLRFRGAIKSVIGEYQFNRLRDTKALNDALNYFSRAIKPNYLGDDDETYPIPFFSAGLKDDPKQGLQGDVWTMKGEVVKGIFDPLITDILAIVQEQVEIVKLKGPTKTYPNGHQIKAIILFGDFEWGEYLKLCLLGAFPGIRMMQPKDPWCAAVKGAVLSQMPWNR